MILIDSYGIVVMNNVSFSNNEANSSSLICIQGRAEYYLDSSFFYNNSLGDSGGIFSISMGALSILNNCNFVKNVGNGSGIIFFISNTYRCSVFKVH